jgi:hypothetical protein
MTSMTDRRRIRLLFALPLFLLMPFLGPESLRAQAQQGIQNGIGALHFMVVYPQKDFKKEIDDHGFGVSFDIGYSFKSIPIALGVQGAFASFGQKSFDVPWSETIQIVNVQVTSSNDMFLGHLFCRFQPNYGAFRPYFEGLLGLAVFTTTSAVKNRSTGEEIASSVNSSDVAFNYGGAGGMAFRVYSAPPRPESRPFEIFIDFRLRYLFGGNAKYYRDDAVYQDGSGRVKFDPQKQRKSETDMITPHLGVQVRF